MTMEPINQEDQDAMDTFLDLLKNKISITTGFIQDKKTGVLTHQILEIKSGSVMSVSEPMPLQTPLAFATAQQAGESLN